MQTVNVFVSRPETALRPLMVKLTGLTLPVFPYELLIEGSPWTITPLDIPLGAQSTY
jgi:hypothetical protein